MCRQVSANLFLFLPVCLGTLGPSAHNITVDPTMGASAPVTIGLFANKDVSHGDFTYSAMSYRRGGDTRDSGARCLR